MKSLFALLAGSVVALGVASAHAASVESQFFIGEVNQGSDNSAEYLINGATSTGVTTVDVGDRLRGMFDVNTVEDLTGGGGTNSLGLASGNNEWAGVFEIEVLTKAADGAGGFDYTFGPSASFTATYGAGAMIAMYEDATIEFTRLSADDGAPDTGVGPFASEEALIANVTDSTLRWVLGFGLDDDELWAANADSDDIAVIGAVAPPGNGGTVNFQVSILQNFFNTTFAQVGATLAVGTDGLIDVNGSGNLLGIAGATTPFDSFDNFDFVFAPESIIPEPATVTLMGLGLVALAGAARRRQRA
jgi:hypothetical protein